MQVSTKSIVEGAFLISIAIILYLIGFYNVFLGIIPTLFCPIPIILLVLRHEKRIISIAFFTAIIALFTLSGMMETLNFILIFLIPGYVMGYYIKKDSSPEKVIFITSLVTTFLTFIFMFVIFQFMQKDLIAEAIKSFESSVSEAFKQYQLKIEDKTKLDLIKDQISLSIRFLKQIYPSIIIFTSILTISINYEITKKIISKLGHQIKSFSLAEVRVPEYLIWGFILSALIKFSTTYSNIKFFAQYPIIEQIVDNALFLIIIIYFFHGISISLLYMKKWNFPTFFIITNIIMFFFSFLWILPMMLGIFDFWFDFKTKVKKIEQSS